MNVFIKNTVQEFAKEIQEQCQNGASQSDIIQMIEDWQKSLVHHKDTTCGLWATDRPDLIKDEKNVMFQISF